MYKSMKECAEMLENIEEFGTGLTDWEEKFVDDIICSSSTLSPKQREIIDRIHSEKVRHQ